MVSSQTRYEPIHLINPWKLPGFLILPISRIINNIIELYEIGDCENDAALPPKLELVQEHISRGMVLPAGAEWGIIHPKATGRWCRRYSPLRLRRRECGCDRYPRPRRSPAGRRPRLGDYRGKRIEAAPGGQEIAVGVELLHAVVAVLHDMNPPQAIHSPLSLPPFAPR
jgi:hypothetical protein